MGKQANERGIQLEVSGVCRLTKDAVRLERLAQGAHSTRSQRHTLDASLYFFFFLEQSEKPQDVNSTGALWWSYEE